MLSSLQVTRWILLLAGVLMVTFAAAVSNAQYSSFLVGGGPDALSWGPTLFRSLLLFHGGLLIAVAALWMRFAEGAADKRDTSEQVAERSSMRTAMLVLIALSIIGLGLRLWNLNSDLWIDEVLTLLDFVRQPFGQMITSFPSQNQHMLYSVLAHASTGIFGESAWSFRLPAVLFGIGSIWALFLLCRRLLGIREALFAAALMTFSYHHIWFSQNARGYTGILFFTLLATWLWFEALDRNEWRWWIGYTAAVVLGMWVHMTMAFVVAAHGLLYLTLMAFPSISGDRNAEASRERRAGLRPIAAWLLSVTATLQLYALALPEFLRVGLHEESKESEWTNPLWVIKESLSGLSIGFAGIAVLICGGAFVAFGWISLFRKNKRLAVLLVLPAILAGSTMLVLGHNLWPRFFFFSMGFGILIVIHGAMQLPAALLNFVNALKLRPDLAAYAGAALATLMILASLVTLPRNYALPKQNFSGAKAYIEKHKLPGDTIVAVGLADVIYGRYLAPDWTVPKTGAELETVTQSNSNVWLVYTIPIELRAFRPDLWQAIQRDYETVQIFPGTLNGGEVFVCQSRNFKEKMNESSRSFDKSEDASVWQAASAK
jgi:mannosyltransferase